MNTYRKVSIFCFICGFTALIIGIINGTIQVGFFLIFPFLIGTGLYAFFGFVLICISLFLFMFGLHHKDMLSHNNQIKKEGYITTNNKIHKSGVLLIGPIPIVFGSNWKPTIIMMIIAIIFIICCLVFYLINSI
jgi:uncharacterized protein (TIGR00304 family)